MPDLPDTLDLLLEPEDNERLSSLCGRLDEHLRQIERRLGIEIANRGCSFHLIGEKSAVLAGGVVLKDLYALTAEELLTPETVHLFLQESGIGSAVYYPLSLHQQTCFDFLGLGANDFPEAEKAAGEVLALPVFPELTGEQQSHVIETLESFFSEGLTDAVTETAGAG